LANLTRYGKNSAEPSKRLGKLPELAADPLCYLFGYGVTPIAPISDEISIALIESHKSSDVNYILS